VQHIKWQFCKKNTNSKNSVTKRTQVNVWKLNNCKNTFFCCFNVDCVRSLKAFLLRQIYADSLYRVPKTIWPLRFKYFDKEKDVASFLYDVRWSKRTFNWIVPILKSSFFPFNLLGENVIRQIALSVKSIG